ncbi:MAG TPA: Holliday junction resolvase RuvX [Oligoflexia bacterium]|nr:Holliday junction resolvase RuvX [Oligoflexia bacterium]HMR24487.1 Holliday junction resolvase RuvX [Oligoflexia bacterium]
MQKKIMALDYGTKRIGIAISDALGMCAHPRDFIDNNSKAFENILKLAEQENIQLLLFGIPKRLSGEASHMQEEIERFMHNLQKKTGLNMQTWDERLTSAQAEKFMISADVKRKKRKTSIDSMAATILLQSYLDSQQ